MKGTPKGKSFNDRELAAEVRTMTLQECKKHLKSGKGKLYNMVLSNLSRSVLPRLNELTGENGGAIVIELPKAIQEMNARTDTSTRTNNKG